MKIDFSADELGLLIQALDVRLLELRHELADADNRAFKAGLHQDLDRLEEIQRRLKEAASMARAA